MTRPTTRSTRRRPIRPGNRRIATTAGAAALAATLGLACGGGDDGRFDAEVAEIRSAVDDGDRTAALQALDDLVLKALAARDEGALSDEDLAEVAALVDSSRALVTQTTPKPGPPPTTASTTTTTTPPPPPEDDEPGKRDDKRKDKDDDDDD